MSLNIFFVIQKLSILSCTTHTYLSASSYRDIYIHVDKQYGDLENGFAIAQSWLNLVEVVINIICIFCYMSNRVNLSNILAYGVTIMTFWKTVLYQLTDVCGGPNGFVYTGHNSYDRLIIYYIIPNGVWLVVPFIIIFKLTKQLSSQKIGDKPKSH